MKKNQQMKNEIANMSLIASVILTVFGLESLTKAVIGGM